MTQHRHAIAMPAIKDEDEPVEALVQRMKERAAELGKLAELVARKLDAQKAPVPSSSAPAFMKAIVPQKATQPYGFLLSNSLSKDFNGAGGAVETTALPSDIFKFKAGSELEDYHLVLDALADPVTRASNRNAMFLPSTKDWQESHAMTEGGATLGFNITVLTASHYADLTHFFVVEDKLRNKMIVAGTAPVDAAQEERLNQQGITYINRRAPDAATKINEFLANGAKWRGEQGKPLHSSTQSAMLEMLDAVGQFVGVNEGFARGATLGKVITEVQSPHRSVQVTRYRTPRS